MDTEKLKSQIREALGSAGIGREISQNIDGIIDSMAGEKVEEKPEGRRQTNPPRTTHHENMRDEDDDDDDDEVPRSAKAAESRAKAPRKTKQPPRKKK